MCFKFQCPAIKKLGLSEDLTWKIYDMNDPLVMFNGEWHWPGREIGTWVNYETRKFLYEPWPIPTQAKDGIDGTPILLTKPGVLG